MQNEKATKGSESKEAFCLKLLASVPAKKDYIDFIQFNISVGL